MEADVEAFKVGQIVYSLKGKRALRGSGVVEALAKRCGCTPRTLYNRLDLCLGAGSLENLRKYKLPRKYWQALSQFRFGDSFSYTAAERLMRRPLRDKDGEADTELLKDALKIFKICHKRVKDHPLNVPVNERTSFPMRFRTLTPVAKGEDPHEAAKELVEGFNLAVLDWEHSLSKMAGEDRTTTRAISYDLDEYASVADPFSNVGSRFVLRVPWTGGKSDPLRDRIAAKTIRELEKLADTLSAEQVAELDKQIRIERCDFRKLKARDCAAVVSDIPYDREWIEANGRDLGAFCKRVLRPGGSAAIMAGSEFLDEALSRMLAGGMVYRWLIMYQLQTIRGAATQHRFPWVLQHSQKPVIILSPDRKTKSLSRIYHDIVEAGAVDRAAKSLHAHAQDVPGFVRLVEMMARAGNLVCDPCVGSGTTAIAALLTGCKFVGCEIDRDRCEIATLRVRAEWARMQA